MFGTKRSPGRRWLSKGCCILGLCGCALSCPATGIKGLGSTHTAALPGAESLLQRRFNKGLPGVLPHGVRGKAAALAETKGTTTVAAGINPFLARPTSRTGRGVTSDGSLGKGKVAYNTGDQTYAIPASVGTQVGANLFESFSQFNLLVHESADFTGPATVQNILARITGGSVSFINGTVQCGINGANLFLINPAGLIFGPGATLRLSGAFSVSTADYVKLADGGIFDARGGADDVLTAGAVSGFQFVTSTPAPVTFYGPDNGGGLQVFAGVELNVVAGNVTLNGETLFAPSGTLTIFCAASAGEAPFSLIAPGAGYRTANFTAFGALNLSNGSDLVIDTAGGGDVVVRAGTIVIDDDSLISASNDGSVPGGGIILDAAGSVIIEGGGQISALTESLGVGGDVDVTAQNMVISGASPDAPFSFTSGIFTNCQSPSQGGGVAVKIADALDIEQGGQITSTTESSGNSGAITVSGRDIALAGGMITAESDPAKEGGAAGDVVVNAADSLSIDDIGEISTSTFGTGKGGDVHVTARDITLSSEGGIFASSDSLTQGGAAGDIVVNATASLRLFTGAEISSSTFGLGNGGNVEVMAPDILLSGAAPGGRFSSGIFAVSASITRGGAAGNLMVTAAGTLDIEDGAVINSATDGLGKGGTVEVTARDILLSGGSDIGVDSFSATQGGAAGDVFVNAGALNVQGGSSISSSTYGLANGGKVEIAAGDITISSAGQIVAESNSTTQGGAAGDVLLTAAGALDIGSGGTISSSTAGLGRGGTVEVTAAEATVDGSIVAVSQSPGKGGPAGNLAVSVAGDLDIESDGDISSSTDGLGNSGSVEVTAGEATVAGIIFATSESSGQGGAAGSVVIDIAGALNIERGGFIDSATVGLGNGGNLNVAAGEITDAGLLLADSESTGQGGPAGVVVVNTPGTLDVEPGGAIDSATSGLGNGGNLDIAAGNVIDSGFVLADSISTGPGGKGGNISVRSAGSLDIQAGGELDSSTFGLGAGGTVTAMARDITVAGRIFANSDSPAQGGNAGDVVVNAAGTLDVEGGGLISSSTLGQGNGGSVKISAQNLAISGKSAIFANSDSSTRGGAGGDISIDVGEALSMNNRAEVGTSAVSGNAGDIAIHVGTDATVEGRSGITSSAGMNGGSIALNAGTLIFLLDSSITATAGSLRETAGNLRNSAGAGGDITLDPEFMILDDSLISANAAVGQGGNILLEANYFFNSGSEITATGATSGTVTITSPQLDLSGALIGLPSAPIDAGSQIQETCAMAVNGDFSSFLALGKGDIEAQPDESQPGSGDSDQVHRVPQARGHPAHRGNGAP